MLRASVRASTGRGQFRLFVGTEILFRVFQTREAILPDLIQQVLLRLVFSPFGTFHSGGVVQGNGTGRAGLQFGPRIGFHGRQAGPVFLRPDRTAAVSQVGIFLIQRRFTASLGLFFDWNYTGKGMLIAEVVEKGPFDTANTRVKAGTVIEKIDGVEITPDADYYTLLNNKARKKTLVSLFDPQTKEHWEEVIIPITNGAFSDLLYSRWVKQRAADVDRWSGGRLGYVHIESMGDDIFRSVYSDILGKYNNREGIVIDTRFNGGGRLHEDIEILFSGQKYFTQVVRGRETCDMPSRRWNKPSIMVMCEANYSNAHGTPWVYSHRGLGKLVGMPVPGTMTSVSWERLQDPSLVFGIPVVGYRLPDGSYLENSQLEPDIKVANSPETIVKGEDTQLKAAVEELLKELEK